MTKYKNEFLTKLDTYDKTKNALIFDDKAYTYEELLNTTDNYITKLKDMTYQSVAIVGDFSFDNIAFILACIECKLNIIPLTKDSQTNEKINESKAALVFENSVLKALDNKQQHSLIENINAKDDSALILFSSGSTGKPKAIVHSLKTFLSKYLNKNPSGYVVLGVFLLDHIAGLDMLFSALTTQGSIVIPKTRLANDIVNIIKKHNVEVLPLSPTMLRLILLTLNESLLSVKHIALGSEKIDDLLIEKIKNMLPNTKIKQNYGATELSSLISKTLESNPTFIKLIDCDYKIINDELYIKSKTQSLGYLNADNSSFTDDGYFATGDLVETCIYNNEEYIKIIGRNKEVINVGGEKVLPSEVEGVMLMMDYIKDCLVYKQDCPIMGNSVAVDVVLSDNLSISNLELKKQIKQFCKDKLATYKIPTKVKIVENLEISDRFKKVRKI